MDSYGVSFTVDLTGLILITLTLVIISIALSILSLILVRSAMEKKPAAPRKTSAPSETSPPKPSTVPKVEKKAARSPPREQRAKTVEIKPVEPEEGIGFASLEDLASMIGFKSILLFNQSGIPIESYNVSDEDRVAASVADFVSLMRKLNPNFSSMISENGQRVMLFAVGKVGEVEVFALTVGGAEIELEVEEVRDFLRAYLSESLGRFR